MDYNLFMPWRSLDSWQKDYIETPIEQDCFLLCGRQVGKTTGMSIKAVELCIKQMKRGEDVLIASITEKQGYLMLAKALAYATAIYPKLVITKGKKKPTMHIINFTNGTRILSYAAGETGEGLRGMTIKKVMIDEGSRMSREFFIAVSPMLSVIKGSMDIASTPCGKEGFFYDCSKDKHFKKFYISAEDCPRHSKEFLNNEKERLGKLAYAQEYLAMFLDEMRRIFSDELIKECCVLRRREVIMEAIYYMGVDVAGFGNDLCTYEIFMKIKDRLEQVENIVEKRNYTTDTSKRIISLNNSYKYIKKIGIDDGGVGFGVYSELMNNNFTNNKTEALNNASREINKDGTKSKKLLKEEMYITLLTYMENGKVKLLDDDEIKDSLSTIQHDEDGKIYGSNSHITEGIIRAVYLASKNKNLNIVCHTF